MKYPVRGSSPGSNHKASSLSGFLTPASPRVLLVTLHRCLDVALTSWTDIPVGLLLCFLLGEDSSPKEWPAKSYLSFLSHFGPSSALQQESLRLPHTPAPTIQTPEARRFPKLSCLDACLFWSWLPKFLWCLLAPSLAFISNPPSTQFPSIAFSLTQDLIYDFHLVIPSLKFSI